jgi:hypothetical protein
MRKKSLWVVAVLAIVAIATMASPKVEFSWKNPSYNGEKFKNIIVLALNGKAANRAEFEDELVAAISRPGTQVSPSYDFIARPDATPIDMTDMRELVREQKIDAIVVARPKTLGASIQVGEQRRPARAVDDRVRVVPVRPSGRGQDQSPGAGRHERVQLPVHLGQRVVRRLVQDNGDEAADGPKAMRRKGFRLRSRRVR